LQPIYLQTSWLIVVEYLKKGVLAQTKNETKANGVNVVGSRGQLKLLVSKGFNAG
jgi:hypothetical protein